MFRQLLVLLLIVLPQMPEPARSPGSGVANPKSVSPGEFVIEAPTLMNLGFEWFIQGDDNRNATVEVSYRKRGEEREPLHRYAEFPKRNNNPGNRI